MGAGSRDSCVQKGDGDNFGQIATCNLNLKATRNYQKKGRGGVMRWAGEEKKMGRQSDK